MLHEQSKYVRVDVACKGKSIFVLLVNKQSLENRQRRSVKVGNLTETTVGSDIIIYITNSFTLLSSTPCIPNRSQKLPVFFLSMHPRKTDEASGSIHFSDPLFLCVCSLPLDRSHNHSIHQHPTSHKYHFMRKYGTCCPVFFKYGNGKFTMKNNSLLLACCFSYNSICLFTNWHRYLGVCVCVCLRRLLSPVGRPSERAN